MVRVADLHCDTIIKVQAWANPASDDPQVEVSLPSMEQGQVGLQVFTCFVSSVLPEEKDGGDQLLPWIPRSVLLGPVA